MNQSLISGSVAGTPRGKPDAGYNRTSNLAGDRQDDQLPAKAHQKQHDAAVAFIIQNEKEVIPWKKKTPISTQDLN